MHRHFVIGAIQVGLVATGAIDAGAGIIGNDQLGRALKIFQGFDVALDPVAQVLVQRGTRKRVSARAENRDEQ
jgi:hypothetical protein